MPASLILLSSATAGVVCWIALRRYVRAARRRDPRRELQRLRRHAMWLEQRLDLARQERCDRLTILSLSDQLGEACTQLARAQGSSSRNLTAEIR